MSDLSEPTSELEEELSSREGGLRQRSVTQQPGIGQPRDARWLSRLAGNQHIQKILARVRGQGRPLDQAARQALEPIFGRDLGQVRIHTEPEAQSAALEVGARALTQGQNIYFGPGSYDPSSSRGRQLVAHEVAHVVQQTEPRGAVASSLAAEGEAQQAANAAAAGRPLDFALSAAGSGPALSPGAWGDDVRAAQALTGSAQSSAMLALVQRALTGANISVTLAGSTSPTRVDPADYQAAPGLNFDPGLNGKQSWPAVAGGPTRLLSANYGYFFMSGAKAYAILGPKALDPDSEIFTQMYANHELYHTQHHAAAKTAGAGGVPSSDQELETWTHDFVDYFHQIHRFRPQWLPLITYYESASPTARTAACTALVSYYNNPPVPVSEAPKVKLAFEHWLHRRLADQGTMQLIKDLSAALNITIPAKTP